MTDHPSEKNKEAPSAPLETIVAIKTLMKQYHLAIEDFRTAVFEYDNKRKSDIKPDANKDLSP